MEITNKQVQAVQDALGYTEEKKLQISGGKNLLTMADIERAKYNYWAGMQDGYKDALRLLGLYV